MRIEQQYLELKNEIETEGAVTFPACVAKLYNLNNATILFVNGGICPVSQYFDHDENEVVVCDENRLSKTYHHKLFRKSNVVYLPANIDDLGFKPSSYDVVVCNEGGRVTEARRIAKRYVVILDNGEGILEDVKKSKSSRSKKPRTKSETTGTELPVEPTQPEVPVDDVRASSENDENRDTGHTDSEDAITD